MKDELFNSYLLEDDQYPTNREGLVSLLNNWKGSKRQQPTTMNTTTVKYEVVFVQKDAYIGDKHSKRVNAGGEEHCHHCWNKYGQWIDE